MWFFAPLFEFLAPLLISERSFQCLGQRSDGFGEFIHFTFHAYQEIDGGDDGESEVSDGGE